MLATSPMPTLLDVLSGPVINVTLWGKSSWFVHVTVVPAFTSMTAGANLYVFAISTWSVGTGVPLTLNGALPLAELLDEQPARPVSASAATPRPTSGRSVTAPPRRARPAPQRWTTATR